MPAIVFFFWDKSVHVLEDVASGVQVGDLEQVIVETLFEMW